METWVQNYTAIGGSLYLTAAAAPLSLLFLWGKVEVINISKDFLL